MPHSRNNGFYHFVWATWNREPLLTADKKPHMHDLIRRQCRDANAAILALNGMPDHIHLFVTLPTTLCIADFVKDVKGIPARLFNDAYGSAAFSLPPPPRPAPSTSADTGRSERSE
jgi:putative transposase